MDKDGQEITLHLGQPRGFCAGVRRAIAIVEEAITEFGAPVYVRHEIVHNKHVIADLKAQGVIFIDDFNEISDKSRPVIFSAHGVPQAIKDQAQSLQLKTIDATCPLVAKVHKQILSLYQQKKNIIVIGKPNHVEIIGTVGQVRKDAKICVINSLEEAKSLNFDKNQPIGFVTQTTLSVDETKDITAYLKTQYPGLETMKKDDICFATTNRQKAVKEMAPLVDVIIVIGSKNSSNSQQLKTTALKNGVATALLIDDANELDPTTLDNCSHIGITAGASAPEYLINELIEKISHHYNKIKIVDVMVEQEKISFKL